MSLYQGEQIFRLVQNGVGANDEVGKRPQAGDFGRTLRIDVEDVPDVFIGALERAKADGDSEEALAAPRGARRDEDFADGLRLTAVNRHRDLLFDVDLEEVFERVVVLVESRLSDRHDEVEEGFESGARTRRVFLHPEDVIAVGAAARNLHALSGAHDVDVDRLYSRFVPSNEAKIFFRLRESAEPA